MLLFHAIISIGLPWGVVAYPTASSTDPSAPVRGIDVLHSIRLDKIHIPGLAFVSKIRHFPEASADSFVQLLYNAATPFWQGLVNLDPFRKSTGVPLVVAYPTYGNWTKDGWKLKVHGTAVYKPKSRNKWYHVLWRFLSLGDSIEDLQPEYQRTAFETLADVVSKPYSKEFPIKYNFTAPTSTYDLLHNQPQNLVGPVIRALDYTLTTKRYGEFREYITLPPNFGVMPPAHLEPNTIQTISMQPTNIRSSSPTRNSSSSAFLVPPRGITIVSDVDEILRDARLWNWRQALVASLALPLQPWSNMPAVYAGWQQRFNPHFHYISMTPYFFSKRYMEFLDHSYPAGSLDTMQMDMMPQTHARELQHRSLFAAFPERKFVLVGDDTDASVVKLFPKLMLDYPDLIACVLLRNTSATDPTQPRKLDLRNWKDMDRAKYFFFNVPDDVANLDFAKEQCVNRTAFPSAGYPNLDVKGSPWRDFWAVVRHSWHCFWSGEKGMECRIPGTQWEDGQKSAASAARGLPSCSALLLPSVGVLLVHMM